MYYSAEGSEWQHVNSRACLRMAVWEEWVWCATARGLLPLPRRPRAPAAPAVPAPPHAPPPPRQRMPVSAVAILHPALYLFLTDS